MGDRSVPDKVCLIRLSAIGDCCNALPLLRTLQKAWPETRFTWIIGKVEATLLGDIPDVEFVVFDKGAGASGFLALRRSLRRRRFDALLHLHASMRANLVSLLVRAPLRLGFDRPRARDRQWLFTNARVAERPNQHVLEGFFCFAEYFGLDDRLMSWSIPLDDDARSLAADTIPSQRPAMIISPCSSQRRRNYRNWSAERYAAVADHAASVHGMKVVLTGGTTGLESEYGQRIQSLCRSEPVNLIGKTTLKQLLALIDRATVVVCPDSGPAHMATAVDTPVIGLYATSNPGRTGPYRSSRWVVDRYPQAVDAEFGKSVDELRWGQRVRDPDAMTLIEVDDVTGRLDSLMSARPEEAG